MSTYWTTVARKKCPKWQKIYNTHDKGVQKWIIPSRQKRRIFPTLDLNIYICGNWHQTVVNPDFLPHICLTDLLGCPFSFRIQASQKYKRYRNKLKNTEPTSCSQNMLTYQCYSLRFNQPFPKYDKNQNTAVHCTIWMVQWQMFEKKEPFKMTTKHLYQRQCPETWPSVSNNIKSNNFLYLVEKTICWKSNYNNTNTIHVLPNYLH